MAVRCRATWHSIASECPLHTYRQCKGQKVAWCLAGDCFHFLVDCFSSSYWEGRGHYPPPFLQHILPTSNHSLQSLTFSRPSKIKSITLWPRTGKHCIGINHLPFHAWLCSFFLYVWLDVVMDGWLFGRLNDRKSGCISCHCLLLTLCSICFEAASYLNGRKINFLE